MSKLIMRSIALAALASVPLMAQVPESEFATRREAFAKRIDSGVVVALGGRTPITDFGTFHQLPAFHYLTNFDDPDAAMVMVVRKGAASTTLFITPADPRRAFYYGWRPDSVDVRKTHNLLARAKGVATLHPRRFRGR
jgi:hypothetical protein